MVGSKYRRNWARVRHSINFLYNPLATYLVNAPSKQTSPRDVQPRTPNQEMNAWETSTKERETTMSSHVCSVAKLFF
ncbi:unnamed protein product [Acanthoscelides obtectus]|uniref:Uncharacterized protein n=1 Tax=Acanthoscelides obtectus TaxID=200917 RepID=A0A9P0JK97_ACAOB|nr:unnamed protein product [Acanthoscelides obtectus]CAK1639909.1 hypothetical protein AOBTE_LOCUS11443 [Acanthoscelides obtectus]